MIRSFIFSQGSLVSRDEESKKLRERLKDPDVQVWVDIESPTEEESWLFLDETFNFHPLAIEDCINVSERPKVEDYINYLFMVIHAVDFSAHEFRTTELNMFIGKNFLLTYHHDPVRSVSSTMDRLGKKASFEESPTDRLTYGILDALLENYGPALEDLSADIAELERTVLLNPSADILSTVLQLKAEVQRLRQIVYPQREVIKRLAHGEFAIVRSHMLPYYRDLHDQLSRISDQAENYRDALTNTLQVHLNLQQMQVNRVIKILTVLATLSMPLLVITSFYGMNVQHVPNTSWHWYRSYGWILGVSVAVTSVVYWVLKRKRWM